MKSKKYYNSVDVKETRPESAARIALRVQIEQKRKTIADIEEKIRGLVIEDILLCDDWKRYEEKEEVHGRGKKQQTLLVGREYWWEEFKDEDGGPSIWIERSRAVKINGEWT